MTDNTSFEMYDFYEAEEQSWRIGQLAERFGISVQTLRYYDEIGVFSPGYRDPNTGYRYYMQTQVYRLANIIYLRKQGYSLDEVRDYLDNLSFVGRSAGLYSQSEVLEKEMKRLQCVSQAIKEKLHYIEISDYETHGSSIQVKHVQDRHYIEIGLEKDLYASEVFYFFPTVVIYAPQAKIFGARIQNKNELSTYEALLPNLHSQECHVKTFLAGEVLLSYYTGPYEMIGRHVLKMITYANEHDIKIANYSIHYNIIDQFVERDPNKYVTEIQIPLRE